ncbi:hypothetical protein ACJJTC_000819 [Scirpophaga incertulas]
MSQSDIDTIYKSLRLLPEFDGNPHDRCMRPETMEKALEYVQDELNTLYLQSRNENGPSHKKEWPPQSLSNQNFNLPLNNFVPKLSYAPTFPRQPLFNIPSTSRQPIQHHSQGWRSNNMPNNNSPRGFTRTQQMFRAPPPNYNPNSNVFKLPNKSYPQQNFTPRPMSGVNPFIPKVLPPTGRDWRLYGNPPPSNYFKTREVNMNEFDYDYNQNYNYYTDYYNCDPQDYYPTEQQPSVFHGEPYIYDESPIVEEIDQKVTSTENFHQVQKLDKPK